MTIDNVNKINIDLCKMYIIFFKDKDFLEEHDIILPNQTQKLVRIDIKYFSIEIIPISFNHFKIVMLTNSDLKLKIIPYYFINLITRKVTFIFINLYYYSLL